MSAIPPGWLASGIQSTDAQSRAVNARDREAADPAAKTNSFTRQLDGAIETGDRDSQVDAEAQGGGSKGRSFSSDSEDGGAPPKRDDAADADAGSTLDLQA